MVRWPKQCRPSITWMQPRRTSSFGDSVLHLVAVEHDRALGDLAALGMQQVGDRLQRRGLAGAVGAEQRHDAALRHVERHALEHQDDVVVDHLDIVDARGCCLRAAAARGLRRPVLDARDMGSAPQTHPLPATRGEVTLAVATRASAYDDLSQASVRFGQRLVLASHSPWRPLEQRPTLSFMGAIQSETFTHLVPSHCCDDRRRGGRCGRCSSHFERRGEVRQAEFLPARRGDVEGLEAAAHVLAVDHLLAGESSARCGSLRRSAPSYRRRGCRGSRRACPSRSGSCPCRSRICGCPGSPGSSCADAVEVERRDSLWPAPAGRASSSPPDHQTLTKLVHREVDLGRFLDRGRVHRAPAPHDHPGGRPSPQRWSTGRG